MEFLVKEWERKWKKNTDEYSDVYHNLGRWDVTFTNSCGNEGIMMTLKKGEEIRSLHGGFRLKLEKNFIEYLGFERRGSDSDWGNLKHVQLQLYK